MKLLRKLWRRSPWVTLPIAVCFAIWLQGTWSRWQDFHVRQETVDPVGLLESGRLQARHMLHEARLGVTKPRKGAALLEAGLDVINLYVPEANLRKLDEHLPRSGREYVEGWMEYDGAVREVDVRYRGDNVYHWGYWKKSWRVKTKKSALFDGMRKINLIAPRTPEVLNNYLAYRLATYLDLLAPKTRLCNVMLNGRLAGLYVLTEQLDESTVRRCERMPGDVYSGELIGRDRYIGADVTLFDHANTWTKVAENNHFDLDSLVPLRALLHHVQRKTEPASRKALERIVDVDAFARFSAFEALSCSAHMDTIHNWRLYYDPWRTRFEPVVWDPVGWFVNLRPRPEMPLRPDVITSPMHSALFLDGEFLRARDEVFREFFASGKADEFLEEARATVAAIEPSLRLDPNLVAIGEHVSPARAIEESRELMKSIETLFGLLRAEFSPPGGPVAAWSVLDTSTIRVEVTHRLPVERLSITRKGNGGGPANARLRFEDRTGTHEFDLASVTSIDGSTIHIDVPLMPDARQAITSMEPQVSTLNRLDQHAATYDIVLDGVATGAIASLRCLVAGEERGVPRRDAIEARKLGWIHRRVPALDAPAPERWEGDVVVTEDRFLEGELSIAAGTTIRIAPGASILTRGRIEALGTDERPIRFLPMDESRGAAAPWGVLGIVGTGADGTVLRHCEFRFGSGRKEPLSEYSAMLSIHDVQDVRIEHCVFADSQVVDDMVHGVYSTVVFDSCVFLRSKFDALDMDISDVDVVACEFVDSGNDALDLMTTTARMTDTRITGSGDKGVSVGERSRLGAVGSVITGCAIGIQSKDDSQAAVVNCDIDECELGVDAYRKNWRYGNGGRVFAHKSRFRNNERCATADKRSRVGLRDCFVDPPPVEWDKQVERDRVDATNANDAVESELRPFEGEVELLDAQPVDASVRGARGSKP